MKLAKWNIVRRVFEFLSPSASAVAGRRRRDENVKEKRRVSTPRFRGASSLVVPIPSEDA